MMRKSGLLLSSVIILLAASTLSFVLPLHKPVPPAVQSENELIQWLTWEEAIQKSQTEKKKIVVDIYTDWCGWCKRLDANTFQQEHIARYINEHYYAVKFNAEQRKDIEFKGKTYKFLDQGRRGYHELAAEITRGRLGYPTIVFLDEDLEVIQAINGYKGPEDFEKIMTYFAKDYYKKMPWDAYQKSYTPMSQPAKD
jgi:thioredoxin-related protein